MKPTILISSLSLTCLVACTVPDVSMNVGEIDKAFSQIETKARPDLVKQAQTERRDAVQSRVARGQTVYRLGAGCALVRLGDLSETQACNLQNVDSLDRGPINATQILAAIELLRTYTGHLKSLDTATSVDAARQSADASAAQISALAKLLQPESRSSANIAAAAPRVRGGLGLALDQYRISALRNVVRRADPVIEQITTGILAWFAQQPSSPVKEAKLLLDASSAMIQARQSGPSRTYTQEVINLENRYAAFDKAWNATTARTFNDYRKSHADLLRRLTDGSQPADFSPPLDDLDATIDR